MISCKHRGLRATLGNRTDIVWYNTYITRKIVGTNQKRYSTDCGSIDRGVATLDEIALYSGYRVNDTPKYGRQTILLGYNHNIYTGSYQT
jgi:hypothetical protein